ncbi:hypothetical protein, partial [Streptomyces clavuligerus]
GPPGPPGASGASGPSGTSSTSGTADTSGASGATGASGAEERTTGGGRAPDSGSGGAGTQPGPGAGAGLAAALLGALVTSVPQLMEQLSPWSRAFLALVSATLGLTVFGVVQARRDARRRRLWITVSTAGGVVSVCAALALAATALLSTVEAAPVAIGFDDEFTLRSQADEDIRVGALSLDAGSYLLSAKLSVDEPPKKPPKEAPEADGGVRITCRLDAERDWDIVSVTVRPGDSTPVALSVAHTYRKSGWAFLHCRVTSEQPRTTALKQVKIIALRVDSTRITQLSDAPASNI